MMTLKEVKDHAYYIVKGAGFEILAEGAIGNRGAVIGRVPGGESCVVQVWAFGGPLEATFQQVRPVVGVYQCPVTPRMFPNINDAAVFANQYVGAVS